VGFIGSAWAGIRSRCFAGTADALRKLSGAEQGEWVDGGLGDQNVEAIEGVKGFEGAQQGFDGGAVPAFEIAEGLEGDAGFFSGGALVEVAIEAQVAETFSEGGLKFSFGFEVHIGHKRYFMLVSCIVCDKWLK
jgi:hypothetical protein